jgi:ribosome-associated heat shock protein Hsp15
MSGDALRMDKWLWQARFFKTRALAAQICIAGRVRVNGVKITKAHFAVRPGQVLTFPQGRRIRVVRVLALGVRRVSAKEAAMLYEDLSDEAPVPRIGSLGRLPQPGALVK